VSLAIIFSVRYVAVSNVVNSFQLQKSGWNMRNIRYVWLEKRRGFPKYDSSFAAAIRCVASFCWMVLPYVIALCCTWVVQKQAEIVYFSASRSYGEGFKCRGTARVERILSLGSVPGNRKCNLDDPAGAHVSYKSGSIVPLSSLDSNTDDFAASAGEHINAGRKRSDTRANGEGFQVIPSPTGSSIVRHVTAHAS